MEFFRIRRDIPFMSHALTFNVISLVTFILAVFFLAFKGLHFNIEFTGGTVIELKYASAPDIAKVRQHVDSLGLGEASVQSFGSSTDLLVRLPIKQNVQDDIGIEEDTFHRYFAVRCFRYSSMSALFRTPRTERRIGAAPVTGEGGSATAAR